MTTEKKESKWGHIFRHMALSSIPYEYVRKVLVYYKNNKYIIHNENELKSIIKSIARINEPSTLSLQEISFDIDFNRRKFKKEVNRRLSYMFDKFSIK